MVSPCDHEEADSRLLVHVKDAVSKVHSKILVRTVDTDVVIITLGLFNSFRGLEELWIAFGVGKHFR